MEIIPLASAFLP